MCECALSLCTDHVAIYFFIYRHINTIYIYCLFIYIYIIYIIYHISKYIHSTSPFHGALWLSAQLDGDDGVLQLLAFAQRKRLDVQAMDYWNGKFPHLCYILGYIFLSYPIFEWWKLWYHMWNIYIARSISLWFNNLKSSAIPGTVTPIQFPSFQWRCNVRWSTKTSKGYHLYFWNLWYSTQFSYHIRISHHNFHNHDHDQWLKTTLPPLKG